MSWLRLDDQFHRHRKVAPLTDAEFRLHVTALLECANQLTDGRIDADVIPTLPQVPAGKALTKALCNLEKRGLWEKDGETWVIHDFLDWNPAAAEVLNKRSEAKERMRRAREEHSKRSAEKQQEKTSEYSNDVRANAERTQSEQTEKFAQPRTRTRTLEDLDSQPAATRPPSETPSGRSASAGGLAGRLSEFQRTSGSAPSPRKDPLNQRLPFAGWFPSQHWLDWWRESGLDSASQDRTLAEARDKLTGTHDIEWWDMKILRFFEAAIARTPSAANRETVLSP